MYIKYIPESPAESILLPRNMLEDHEYIPERLILNIGQWKKEVRIHFNEKSGTDYIGLAIGLTGDFTIPETFDYEIHLKGINLTIGPIIGYLSLNNKNVLRDSSIEELKIYYSHCLNAKGLIYLCSPDALNMENHTIEGYYLNLSGKKKDQIIMPGVFPYPSAMFRRMHISQKKLDVISEQMDGKLFNSYIFDKWEMWKFLSPYEKIRNHLPHTIKLLNFKNLDSMLNLYGSVFLKHTLGNSSEGIMKIDKIGSDYEISYHLKRKIRIKDEKEMSRILKGIISRGDSYIVQQTISHSEYDFRTVDFRVILQKNAFGEWASSGVIARFGSRFCITSAYSPGAYALPGVKALKKIYGMKDSEASNKLDEMVEICIKACKILDKTVGNFGDMGIDVILDKNQKAWILEINNRIHDHKLPLLALNDMDMYRMVVITPFEYARFLCFNQLLSSN